MAKTFVDVVVDILKRDKDAYVLATELGEIISEIRTIEKYSDYLPQDSEEFARLKYLRDLQEKLILEEIRNPLNLSHLDENSAKIKQKLKLVKS